MNEQKLSKRLATVAKYVPKGSRVADIGSDHAYLPAWLVLNGKISSGIAGEVVQGPFESARSLVAKRSLTKEIDVRLGNGLDVVSPADQVTAITIAGMGGTLISEILAAGLAKGNLTGRERLILQPNVAEKTLRQWLQTNSYKIIAEEIIAEDGKFYEVIVAEKSPSVINYSIKELTFGPFLVLEQNEVFKAKWQAEMAQQVRVLAQLEQAKVKPVEKIAAVKRLLQWLEEEVMA